MEGQHQARAASEEHANTLETLQRQLKRSVCQMVRRDVLMPLVAYNYGPDAARTLTPNCSLGGTEQQDWAAEATAVAQLARAGYIDSSQFAGIDARLGLPERAEQTAQEQEQDRGNTQSPPADDGQDAEGGDGTV
jgi:phage gp29-like protein